MHKSLLKYDLVLVIDKVWLIKRWTQRFTMYAATLGLSGGTACINNNNRVGLVQALSDVYVWTLAVS